MTAVTDVVRAGVLDGALATVAAELDRAHIPGLELAVVHGGDLVFAGGVGVRGVADQTPVGAATRFHHGSCGKAYTGLLAALLAEAGVVELDRPVRRYVPELQLPDPVIAERVTLRDLLSHRSGLARHDLVWILDGGLDRAAIVRRLEHLPLAGDLRNQWRYSNLAFMLAGHAMERVTGTTFEQLVQQHLLDPLAMTRTTYSLPAVLADDDHARPHVVRDGVAVETSWREDASIAPAGGLISCANDSVRWLLAHLGETGAMSRAAVELTHSVQTPVPAGVSPFPEVDFYGYGLGWVLGAYRDRKLVWHNGGVDGFGSQTLLLPREQLGVVASANVLDGSTTLALALFVADCLLGDGPGEQWFSRVRAAAEDGETAVDPAGAAAKEPAAGHPATRPLAAYAGTYRDPGYGELVVRAVGGELAVRIAGSDLAVRHVHYDTWQLTYERLSSDFTLTFTAGADGAVVEALVPLDDATPPVRFRRVDEEPSR